jgi:hypothetical protein
MSKAPRLDTPTTLDPQNVNGRLYRQLDALLTALEKTPNIGIRDRIAALVAIGRIQTLMIGLRKEGMDGPGAGSAVRKYASAFSPHAARRRAPDRGPAGLATPDDDDDYGEDTTDTEH